MLELEQLTLKDLKDVKPFLNDFVTKGIRAGNLYSKELGEKMFMKIPTIGLELIEQWNKRMEQNDPIIKNLWTRAGFVVEILKEKCQGIKTTSQLNDEYGFCMNM